jgi:hypothetical protein
MFATHTYDGRGECERNSRYFCKWMGTFKAVGTKRKNKFFFKYLAPDVLPKACPMRPLLADSDR